MRESISIRGGPLQAGENYRLDPHPSADATAASAIQPTATVDSIADVPDLLVSSSPPPESVAQPDGAADA